ncbi:MAG: YgaP-like transmembrane domain [Candidatus Omnitrophota bacterium]
MFKRHGQMPPEEIFTRTIFGVLLITAAFVPWGRWVSCILGVLFLISAFQGFCLTCFLYKKFISKKDQ